MKQKGRRSYADELVIETLSDRAVLKGNARVEDDEYGVAEGNEIVLEKGKRRAKVIGGKDVRPSLQLPKIPDFGFPK
jgi:lipopolysaccharide export system protein LptA